MDDRQPPGHDGKGNHVTSSSHVVNGKAKTTQNGLALEEVMIKNGGTESEDDGEEEGTPKKKIPPIGFFQLFRYSDTKDKVLMILGTLAAIGNGSAFPLNLLIYGQVLNIFITNKIARLNATAHLSSSSDLITNTVGFTTDGTINSSSGAPAILTVDSFADIAPVWPQVQPLIWYFCLIGACVLVLGYMEIAFWSWAAERQTRRIRTLFLGAILRQHIGWFDTHPSGELNTRLSGDIIKINSGIGDKLATMIQWMTTFFAGYVIGFAKNWKLTLVILAVAPLLVITLIVMARTVQRFVVNEQNAYAKAGSIAEETLANIRTVAAFGGEEKEAERYSSNLDGARKLGIKRGLVAGVGQGTFWVCIFGAFALAFWYGSTLVATEGELGGSILQVFMGVMVGTMSLGHAAPNLEYISSARGAAAAVFSIIDLESEIDSSSDEGETPEDLQGNIEFTDVDFSYPARPEVQILDRFSLKVKVGQTVALVGASGCGKSTTIQLLQRFYDPSAGVVKLDGKDIRELNIRWLRQRIGVVSQEPVLFATTIKENIAYGHEGVTQSQIEKAAKQANALDFILKLPQKFNTLVGSRGAQLSGGQKQRIAIARALVRNPKVLLLDEATSALDMESEAIVQDALDKARQGRTTIVIAHRLSTIRNADVIVGISDGQVLEMGTHDQLMAVEGIYHQLYTSQTAVQAKDKTDDNINNLLERLADAKSQEADEGDGEFHIQDPLLVAEPDFQRLGSWAGSGRKATYSRQDSSDLSKKNPLKKGSIKRTRQDSTVSDVWSEKEEEELVEKLPPAPVRRIFNLNAPEWPYILIGCIAAIFTGATHPLFAILFSEVLGNFATRDPGKQAQMTTTVSILFVSLGAIVGIASVCQQYFFSLSGENLTLRLRQMAFRSMLRQDIAWYDDRVNQVGALTARLETDASAVRGAAGQQMGVIVQSCVNMGTAITVAFIFGPKLTCVVIAFLPFLVFSGMAQGKMLKGFSRDDTTLIEEGGKIAVESIDNIRTVAALTLEPTIQKSFSSHFDLMYWKGVKKSHVYGIFYSFSQCVVFFAYAATFSYGSQLIDSNEMDYRDVFRVFASITFGGQALGRAGSYAPDLTKAKMAAAKLFMLFDRQPAINSASSEGLQPGACYGKLDFQSVRFRYPTRPKVEVLQRLNLSVLPGETLALVGSSGCGKSTTVQLIERFYDCLHGSVKIDGRSVKELNVQWLRRQLGLVSQEPILFDTTIAENIAYGANHRSVSMDEVIAAARGANIHTFIDSLPQGYETNVGEKGTQLSGGQKQRVAIARALVRNPKILLLDEATSALDTESEQVVQEALDKARKGRTCITIAHRLSTIQNANTIAVIHNGHVVEQGTHQELLHKKGYYYKLYTAQTRRREAAERLQSNEQY